MRLFRVLVALCLSGAALGGITMHRAGWLDQAVSYHKQLFVKDVLEVAPIEIKASLQRAPAGYTDTAGWDYSSVARLLALLGASESAAPVRRKLRRALNLSQPSRRFFSKHQSWKLFPSLGKDHPNEIYYDFGSGSQEAPSAASRESWEEGEDVVVLENPVEARLPGAQITVKLLREILEARALAARTMPKTTKSTIAWVTTNMTSTAATEAGNVTDQTDGTTGGGDVTNAGGDGETTVGAGATGNDAGGVTGDGGTTPGGSDATDGGESVNAENSARTFLSANIKRPRGADHMENSQI